MCLTLANATIVLEHRNPAPPARGYTRTLHHAGHLSPGDLWRPVDGQYPRTAILVHRHRGRITVTDQYGEASSYPTDAIIPTAVPDAFPRGRIPGRSARPTARGAVPDGRDHHLAPAHD